MDIAEFMIRSVVVCVLAASFTLGLPSLSTAQSFEAGEDLTLWNSRLAMSDTNERRIPRFAAATVDLGVATTGSNVADDTNSQPRREFGPFSLHQRDRRGFYLGGSVGASIPQYDDVKTGFTATGALGYYLGTGRIELELGYHRHSFDENPDFQKMDGNIQTLTAMVNGILDVDITRVEGLDLYIGGGAGVARNAWDLTTTGPDGDIDEDETGFAFQFMLGVNWMISENFGVLAGIRGVSVPFPDHPRGSVIEIEDSRSTFSVLEVGARYRF